MAILRFFYKILWMLSVLTFPITIWILGIATSVLGFMNIFLDAPGSNYGWYFVGTFGVMICLNFFVLMGKPRNF